MTPKKPCLNCGAPKPPGIGRKLCAACVTSVAFWRRVDRTGDCWVWIGRVHKLYGYAAGGRLAHRVAYELEVGPIPEGLEIDHLCRTPLCVNPAHLEPVDRLENQRRRSLSRTHCNRGHELTEENVRVHGRSRICRACQRENSRAASARRKAKQGVTR